MGILDNASEWINKGVNAADRGTRIAGLTVRKADLERQREQACAALGAVLFAEFKNDEQVRANKEDLFVAVELIDAQLTSIAEEQAAIEEEKRKAQEASSAASAGTCASCNAPLQAGASFCGNCGTKIEEAVYEEPSKTPAFCGNCGNAVESGSVFCGNCGNRL